MTSYPKSLSKLLLLLMFTLCVYRLNAQIFSGRVTDRRGEGIPFATVYIHELKSGISADLNGEFLSKLSPGRYTLEASSLGFKREQFVVEMGNINLYRTLVLEEISYELNEALFSGRRDDRGSVIMRKAIAKAPYFKYQVREYDADSYLKGTFKITKVPALLKLKSMKDKVNLFTGKLFLLESFSTVKFSFPDKYEHTIKAFSSTIPDEISPGDYSVLMKSSIYDPQIFGLVSPLSPKAFTYYKFIYQGVSNESGRVVNKILVVPKRGNSKLFAGTLYIVDNMWSVSYAELVSEQSGIKTNIKVNYNEVADEVFLPTTYNINASIDVMGVKGEGRFYSSMKYTNLKRNSATISNPVTQVKPVVKERSLEIKETPSNTTVKVDSSANKRDSAYWLEVRKVPLRVDEVVSYQKSDSIKIEFREIEKRDSVKNQNSGKGGSALEQILFGHKYKISKDLFFSFGGLSKVVGDFNFVDGYQLGQNISINYNAIKFTPLKFDASAYYSLQRRLMLWNTSLSVRHSPLKNGFVNISAGRESSDISDNPGVNRFINSYSSWLFAINPVKLMDKKYFEITTGIDIANGLQSSVSIAHNTYSQLENGDYKSLFGALPELNIPENIYGGEVLNLSSFMASASLQFTPRYYYKIDNGYKRYVKSSYPTFTVKFIKAFKCFNAQSSWSRLETGIRQKIKTDIYSSLSYNINAGVFLSSSVVSLPDYKHFAASDQIFSNELFDNRYLMLGGYHLSTSDSWVDLKVNYNTEYLLLKRLPFLNTPLITESLHLKSLWLPGDGRHHTELGYSIGMDDLGRAGLFVSFNGIRYKGVSFRITIPLFKAQ